MFDGIAVHGTAQYAGILPNAKIADLPSRHARVRDEGALKSSPEGPCIAPESMACATKFSSGISQVTLKPRESRQKQFEKNDRLCQKKLMGDFLLHQRRRALLRKPGREGLCYIKELSEAAGHILVILRRSSCRTGYALLSRWPAPGNYQPA